MMMNKRRRLKLLMEKEKWRGGNEEKIWRRIGTDCQ